MRWETSPHVYPVMRGTSPLLVPLVAVAFLGESLPWWGWAGILSVVTGIFLMGARPKGPDVPLTRHALWLALGVGVSIALYATWDKISLAYVPPLLLNTMTNLGNLLVLTIPALRSGRVKEEWRQNWKTIIMTGILAPGGYLLFLVALSVGPVAQLAPMREVGIVFATLLGVVALKEPQGNRRMAAAAIIMTGVILLGLS